jgi:lipopolysaccharide biosynthesis regulator YciM
MRNVGFFLLCFICVHLCFISDAQPGTTIDLKKPEKYENRTLASEKTTEDKIKHGKKFYQNTVTHYNYVFNANLRLNGIIDRAKQSFKDDYTQLLPYYNYSLDITATDPDIDSVIYKCNAGILLHDLRNDWIDDLYFLMGKAYYLRKNFDSAENVFLYVNYAFAPKDEGYDVPIGSNANNTEFSIATKEKKGFSQIFSNPPKRNEDLIWIAKNYIDAGKPYEASAILEMLRYDPNFPQRLQPELHETIGYLFYKSKLYDSTAFHLSKATDMDDDKQDKARREYLLGQLYMLSGSRPDAQKYFTKSADHTVDPFMAVYASLNAINASPDSANVIDKKIASLMNLAKKDRYVAYRDLIYYTAAEVEMQSGNYPQSYQYAKKSLKYNINNPVQRSRSFMLLGDLDYLRPDYEAAKHEYDSVDMGTLGDTAAQQRLTQRLTVLQVITANIHTVKIEDSLQAIARMPEAQRVAFIRKTVRQLRKEQGLKEEDTSTFVNPAVQLQNPGGNNGAAGNDLFSAQASGKGDWYFNNNALKSAGFTTFRSTWGNRPDVDDWRRSDAVSKQIAAASQGNPDGQNDSGANDLSGKNQPALSPGSTEDNVMNGEISYDALLANLPLTDEKMQASNNKIIEALFSNGQQFQNVLEDYNAAIDSYDTLLKRYPQNDHLEESLYDLYYCYNKLGKKFSADSALTVLTTKYKDGKFAKMLSNRPTTNKPKAEDPATKEYEKIYDLFIEGKFDEAKSEKAIADSLYGNSYWTPQLLYIESIYFVSRHEDSSAIETLTQLSDKFASSPLSEKAETMINVLRHRSEIEAYLTNLQITRLPEDEPSPVVNLSPVENIIEKKEIKKDTTVSKPANKVAAVTVDTVKAVTGAIRTYVFNASDSQFVGIMLNKVDPVYANETRNAFNRYNQINFYNQKINITSAKLNDSLSLVLLGPFTDAASAMIYVDKVKPKAPGEIIPWLKPEKYSFTIISHPNLDVLNDTKDVNGYKALIEKVLPGKF